MSTDSTTSTQKDPTKNRRTRTGCLTCRARKIKCDERQGRCDNCERIMAQCDWPTLRTVATAGSGPGTTTQPQPSSDSGFGSIGPVRSRSKSKSKTRRASSIISTTPAQSQMQLPPVPTSAIASAVAGAGGTSRSRSRACVACRIARCKCSSELPSCSGCLANDTECKYADTPSLPMTGNVPVISIDVTPSSDGNHANQSPAMVVDVVVEEKNGREKAKTSKRSRPADDSGPETDTKRIIDRITRPVIDQHVEAFYKFFYHAQSNAFIHRGTLLRDIQTSQISPMLLLALCAVSARFVPSTTVLQGGSWAKESKTLLILSEEISLEMVATALLLAKYEINNGKYEGAWVLTSIAHRAALALGLHREISGEDDENLRSAGNKGSSSNGKREAIGWVTRETRRRLFWACYCLDRMMSTGQPDYILTQQSSIHIRLPCEDHNYQLGIPCITPMLAPESSISHLLGNGNPDSPSFGDSPIGLFGHYVQMTGMRYRVLVCTRTQDHTIDPPWSPTSTWAQCAFDLQTWRATLSAPFQLTTDTVYARQAQGDLTSLIMLHIWYDQCLSDLYRVALPGFPESLSQDLLASAPEGWVNETRQACVRHAKNISNVLDTIKKHVDNDAFVFLDPSLPICVYESMRVQVQALFLAQDQDFNLQQQGTDEDPSRDSQQRERVEILQQDFDGMMSWVEKMCKYFRQANYLLREMRKLLQRHALRARSGTESSIYDTSGAATPHHPWKRRVQQLKASDVQHEREHQGSNTNLMVTALASASGSSTNHINLMPSTAFSNENHTGSIGMGSQSQHALVPNMNPAHHMMNYDFGLTSDPNANANTGTGLDNGSLSMSLSGTHENEQDAIHALLGGFDEQNVFGMGMGLDLSTGPDMGTSLGTGVGATGTNDLGMGLGMGVGVGMGNWFGGFGGWMAAGYDPFGDNST